MPHTIRYFVVALAFALTPSAPAAAQPQRALDRLRGRPTPTHANVKYGPHERNVLDFYKADADAPTPPRRCRDG